MLVMCVRLISWGKQKLKVVEFVLLLENRTTRYQSGGGFEDNQRGARNGGAETVRGNVRTISKSI